jgi:hypothetical protein
MPVQVRPPAPFKIDTRFQEAILEDANGEVHFFAPACPSHYGARNERLFDVRAASPLAWEASDSFAAD